MLLWLQQRSLKNLFLLKLAVLSAITHVVLCFMLFFLYKDYQQSLLLQVHSLHNPDNVIIRLLPFSMAKPKVQIAKKVVAKSSVAVAKKTVKKTVIQKKVTQRTQIRKVIPKPKVVQKKEVVKQKPEQSKKVIEKKVIELKKEEPKIEQKSVEKKQEIAKTEPVPVKEELKVEQVADPSPQSLTSPQVASDSIQPVLNTKDIQAVLEEEENVRYVTHKELRGIELENAIQAAIQEVWNPPVGVDKDIVSEVVVIVGWDGKLVESKIIKLSEVIIYDVSVQEALEEIKFPRQVWGKEIKIAFRV